MNQPDLVPDGFGGRTEHFTQHIEIALDHRDRIIDLVCDPCGEFANGGQFFAHHQLLLGAAQGFVGFAQLGSSLRDLAVELVRPALQFLPLGRQRIEQVVEFDREPPQFVLTADRAYPGLRVAPLHLLDHPVHAFDRFEHAARPAHAEQ